ncbi:hypothetical protein EAH68_04105 [Corynebacterium hylobatis]|uniref:Uncharacterized protein n=1 Tax=Corynebacterium hylobatis TaxID=1859290 RepID=A0A430HZI1_9CORY|nr:hypothetical protein [Corynebacterium hylobatis]RSZ64194.1 hypothetical protein EAH68_04105 [Corynebacterium hylobatis]
MESNTANVPTPEKHAPQGIIGVMAGVLGLFTLMTICAALIAIAYAYGGGAGLIGWVRLPLGLEPFLRLNLAISDIVAYAALFVAILLAATVQLNSTVSAADSIADNRPASAAEARAQQRDLQTYANQAEMSMLVSFGAAFAVLLMTLLFGFAEIAGSAAAGDVDRHGVGWVGFVEVAPGLVHPRIFFMYVVSFLLFLTTYASLPEWKNTGLFRRQVEDNAWEARARLALIAAEHDLSNVDAIRPTAGARTAALAGYLLYLTGFALALNLSLALFAGEVGFNGIFTAGQFPLFFLFGFIAMMLSSGVGAVMLRIFHLHGRSSVLSVTMLVLVFLAVFYVVSAEGASWVIGLGVAMSAYLALWVFLYWRGSDVLDQKDPTTWEFFLNPPKYFIVHRYEAIRRSAEILEDENAPLTGG